MRLDWTLVGFQPIELYISKSYEKGANPFK